MSESARDSKSGDTLLFEETSMLDFTHVQAAFARYGCYYCNLLPVYPLGSFGYVTPTEADMRYVVTSGGCGARVHHTSHLVFRVRAGSVYFQWHRPSCAAKRLHRRSSFRFNAVYNDRLEFVGQ